MTAMEMMISIDHLVHRFGSHLAVDDLTFSVGRGEVFGLLGPNGAGKTTTVRLLNGLYQPSGGSMRVLGFNPTTQGEQVRRQTGVLTETPALYERLTALQNLDFFAILADMPLKARRARIQELLEFFDLEKRARDRVGTFSKGMKQRLALARALLNRPELVFLDEPTSGLDPESAQQVHTLINNLRRRDGHTVFLCTHNLVEAERLCDRLGILKNGRLLAAGSLAELRRLVSPGLWVEIGLLQPMELPAGLAALPGVLRAENAETASAGLRIEVQAEADIPALVAYLAAAGAQIITVQPRAISLEEIYFHLQGEARQEEESAPGGAK